MPGRWDPPDFQTNRRSLLVKRYLTILNVVVWRQVKLENSSLPLPSVPQKRRLLKLPNVAAATNFFVPNTDEFFLNILSMFHQCTACLDSVEQYEGTLRVMYQRVT